MNLFQTPLLDFNSIKVQLEPWSLNKQGMLNAFQFHKGTIRTAPVRIRSRTIFYFNSIKVQLEHRLNISSVDSTIFQFHKGTIRTFVF